MPTAPAQERSNTPGLLLPRRGPVQFIFLVAPALITMALPIAYFLAVQGIGMALGWGGFVAVKALLAARGFPLVELCSLTGLAVAGAGWVAMVRPLLPAPRAQPAAIRVTKNTQPSLFALLETLSRHLRIAMPVEVWLDCTGAARTSVRQGLLGVPRGELVLSIGLPMIAALSARELAAVLAMQLGQCSGGLTARLAHIVRETDAWFFRALHHRDPWEELPVPLVRSAGTPDALVPMKKAAALFVWVCQRPFWIVMSLSRMVGWLPLLAMKTGSHQAALRLIGPDGFDLLRQKQKCLVRCMRHARKIIDDGTRHTRLPENVSLLVARLFAKEMDAAPPIVTRTKSTGNPPAARLIDQLPSNAEGAGLIRQFVDLSRQITFSYYQHELGIVIHKHRLVAEDETHYQKRHQAEALGVIRRYFGGLMHPERALCGLAITGTSTDAGDLAQEVVGCRQWEKQYEQQIRIALREWNLAWQRRRDLECAWVLTLAGYAVCRQDYGTDQSNPETYRREAKAQKLIMDHLDDPLSLCESHLEKRFAAALGMLWYSQLEILPDRLVEMRKQMPLWASVFEALAAVLPEFRELLTSFYSFQTLRSRVASASDSGAFASAMQSIVPGMMARARHISHALDGACYPFNEDGIAIPLSDYLCASLGGSAPPDPHAAPGMHAMARQMARDAAVMLTPFVDHFLELYHRSFAWLAAAAEASENYFVGPVSSDDIISSEVESLAALIKTEDEMQERVLVAH